MARTSNLISNLRGFLAAADTDDRVHPQINTLRAKTARMSITGPARKPLRNTIRGYGGVFVPTPVMC